MRSNNTDTFTNNYLVGRYNKKIAYLIGGLGVLSLTISIIDLLTGGGIPHGFISGIGGLLISYLYLTKPYFTYENGELYLYNLLGIKIKKYQLDSLNELTVENNKIYLQRNENKRKIDISKLIVNKDDWDNLVAQIKQ